MFSDVHWRLYTFQRGFFVYLVKKRIQMQHSDLTFAISPAIILRPSWQFFHYRRFSIPSKISVYPCFRTRRHFIKLLSSGTCPLLLIVVYNKIHRSIQLHKLYNLHLLQFYPVFCQQIALISSITSTYSKKFPYPSPTNLFPFWRQIVLLTSYIEDSPASTNKYITPLVISFEFWISLTKSIITCGCPIQTG